MEEIWQIYLVIVQVTDYSLAEFTTNFSNHKLLRVRTKMELKRYDNYCPRKEICFEINVNE